MKTEIIGTIICGLLVVLSVGATMEAASVIKHAIEQMQTYDCLTRPWLDTAHGC